VGTIVATEDGVILVDLTEDEQQTIIAPGGRGGFGNAHFISSVRQAPGFAEKGEEGQNLTAVLELKMIADVGLVGLPNAGKSTFLSTVSNARPEIADYAFTTLTPNLGVVDIDHHNSLLFADIPGLIEGAADGKGLGHEFLRHIERTSVLVHLIDAYQDDIVHAYQTIQGELASYKADLPNRPQIVALNKTEGMDQEMIDDLISQLKAVIPKGTKLFAISAKAGTGVSELLYAVKAIVDKEKQRKLEIIPETAGLPVLRITNTEMAWRVTKEQGYFMVTGSKIEKFAARTDFTNEQGIRRLRDIMKKMGVMHELQRQKIIAGQEIRFGTGGSFEY
jgi:GTP-binding protein